MLTYDIKILLKALQIVKTSIAIAEHYEVHYCSLVHETITL